MHINEKNYAAFLLLNYALGNILLNFFLLNYAAFYQNCFVFITF